MGTVTTVEGLPIYEALTSSYLIMFHRQESLALT